MGRTTGIAWTDATFNPWWGCTSVSPGCTHCYAETLARRFGPEWGTGSPRRYFGEKHWREPRKWNRVAERDGIPLKVFCASMGDVFDNEVPQEHRERLWSLIEETPWLSWQLLTKRIGNVEKMVPSQWGRYSFPPHVWLGISVVNQEEASRDVPKLLRLPCSVKFLSVEPMLGPIDLSLDGLACLPCAWCVDGSPDSETNAIECRQCGSSGIGKDWGIDQVIIGGESGPKARPMEIAWARSLVEQCKAARIPCFVKQLGGRIDKRDDMEQFPIDLRVRRFPT